MRQRPLRLGVVFGIAGEARCQSHQEMSAVRSVMSTILLALIASTLLAQEPGNLVRNGTFEQVSVEHPEGWALTEHGNECALSVGPGIEGRHAARLSCAAFRHGWVIMAQDGVVKVKKGQWYRLSFRCRGEGLAGGATVALYNRKPWVNCGLGEPFEATKPWTDHTTYFRATRDAEDTRFEFYFSSSGVLCLDDIELVPSGPAPLKGEMLPARRAGNLLLNSSFELGGYGWGTEGRDSLAAEPTTGGRIGDACLRIKVDPERVDEYAVDWFEPRFWKVYGNLIGSDVWVRVAPGKPLTLSAYLRSDGPALRARLEIGEARRTVASKTFDVGAQWQRCQITGTPKRDGCFVRLGIDIGDEPQAAELFVDGVQLEQGAPATEFAPRQDIEIALSTEHYGNIFMADETVVAEVAVCSASAGDVPVIVKVADCWDRVVHEQTLTMECTANQAARQNVRLDTLNKGFFRITAGVADQPSLVPAKLRLAKVEPLHETFAGQDGAFGINHASPAPSRLPLMQTAGITWVRDWSIKWHQVQAAAGAPFDFAAADKQIQRVLDRGFKVLCVLPHPATPWCTTAPADSPRTGKGRAFRRTLSNMPAELDKFGAYVRAAVSHYRDRVKHWEILNEPGYLKPEDYAKLLAVAYRACKDADPACHVIGGCGAGPASKLEWYRDVFEQDGLKNMDLVNLHPYPGRRPGRAYEQPLKDFNECMDEVHRRLPIWNTEFLYCSDDDPLPTVMTQGKPAGACRSELEAASSLVQYTVVLLANGCDKFFQHTNHWPLRLTRDTLIFSMFFDYGATPKKAFAAHNAMAGLFGLKPKCVRVLDLGPERYAAAFDTDDQALAVLWRERYTKDFAFTVPADATACDMMGNVFAGRQLTVTNSPLYITSRLSPSRLADQLDAALGANR